MKDNSKDALVNSVLSDSEFRILKNICDAVLITRKDGTIVYLNDAYARLLGIPAEAILYRKLTDVQPNSPALRAMANGTECYNVPDLMDPPDVGAACSVLLMPSPEDFTCSVTILNLMNPNLTHHDFRAKQRYVESYLDARIAQGAALPAPFSKLVGMSKNFRIALYMASKASKADFPVLVTGESGVGKELLVRAIHESSHRSSREFVSINCAAIPSTLIESELFGYESGSFTGGRREGKKGLFDQADKGTIFFDEVGDFELSTQAKILRVLEEKEFRRIGGQKCIPVNTRVLGATNRELEKMMVEGKFRVDLYYRLNTMTIHVPPLRERGRDIELLAEHFLSALARQSKKTARFSRDTMNIFYAHDWPGNARELRSVVHYALNMTDTEVINPGDLPPYLLLSDAKASLNHRICSKAHESNGSRRGFIYRDVIDAFEKDLIEVILQRYRSRTKAMEALGLSRRSFYLKLKKHGLSEHQRPPAGTEGTANRRLTARSRDAARTPSMPADNKQRGSSRHLLY
ncbi:MAG TPA: sigma 54-interacting transcriptional regulator [Syntrophobacteraceae bacterium]|nr:sigma 54-interacting transcriptional regulator [Syntrophobacteraceae bacterium]